MREHLAKVHEYQLMKPLAAAAGALLAWKYLPTMTEELWNHALLFLDRHRSKQNTNNEIVDLYQFADPTGILEKHKEMLFQPFTENKVDMKIIYYELIKMLIDYERRNNPTAYDATKLVAKIDGYQELTNKLQRFLNQRFILDIQKLSKSQEEIPINISGKLEKLEEEFSNMKKAQDSLEGKNRTLITEINKLKKRETEITKKLEAFESIELSLNESNRKLLEKIENIELEGKRLDDGMIELKIKQELELQKISDQTKKNSLNVKHVTETNQGITNKLEAQERTFKQTWKSIEHSLTDHRTTLSDIGTVHETKNDELKKKIFELSENAMNTSKTLENNERGLKIIESKISEHANIFQRNDIEQMTSKIEQMQDTFQKNTIKMQEIDVVSRTVNLMEESRQQSFAKSKDEVDKTRRNNLTLIEKVREDIQEKVSNLHKELKSHTALNNDRVRSLQSDVTNSVQSTKESVIAAEAHVENLRQLNRNVIDQLKEKNAKEQDVFKKNFKFEFQESLSIVRTSLSSEMSQLQKKSSTNSSGVGELANKMEVLGRQVTTMIGNEEKIKDIVNTIESNQRMEQNNNTVLLSAVKIDHEKLDLKINEMKKSQEVHKKAFCDEIAILKQSCAKHYSEYEETTADQSIMVAKTNEKLSAIMDTASRLLRECAVQENKIKEVEKNSKDLDKKLSDLESADLFLQEAQKLVVERTDASEQHIKLMEKDWLKASERQKTDIQEQISKENKSITDKVDVLNLTFETHMKEKNETDKVIKSLEDDISKVDNQLNTLTSSENTTNNQIEKITKEMGMYDIQLKEIKPYIEKMESFENKVSCIENKMKNEIAELSKQSEEARKGIENNNGIFLTIETKVNEAKEEIGRVNRDVVQQKDQIEVIAKQNATQILETKNEINIKKDIVIKSIEELKIEFEGIKTTQVLESSKSENMEEKLGELVNTCQSFDQRITSLEEVSSEQSRLVKASENSSKEVLELVENEIKADIRNSKDELRKQRCVLVSQNTCMARTRHQLDAVLLHLKLTA